MSRRVVGWAMMFALVALAFALACSGSNNGYQTGPGGGGGGGGGGGALELNSGNIAGGGAGMYSHTFNTAGSYRYHCTIHNTMYGSVVVVASGHPMAAAVSISGGAGAGNFVPPADTVDVGGTVTWTNNATSGGAYPYPTTHTVTSY